MAPLNVFYVVAFPTDETVEFESLVRSFSVWDFPALTSDHPVTEGRVAAAFTEQDEAFDYAHELFVWWEKKPEFPKRRT